MLLNVYQGLLSRGVLYVDINGIMLTGLCPTQGCFVVICLAHALHVTLHVEVYSEQYNCSLDLT